MSEGRARARALALLRAGVTLGASGAVRARDPKPRAIKGRWRRRRVPGLAGWTGSPVPPLNRSSSCLGAWLGKLRPQGWEKRGRDGSKQLGPVHLGVCCSKLSRCGGSLMGCRDLFTHCRGPIGLHPRVIAPCLGGGSVLRGFVPELLGVLGCGCPLHHSLVRLTIVPVLLEP